MIRLLGKQEEAWPESRLARRLVMAGIAVAVLAILWFSRR